MKSEVATLKSFLTEKHEEIRQSHASGADGFETCRALTDAMDSAITSLFQSLVPMHNPRIAVLALGGYGRHELCPRSDIDIMIVRETGSDEGNSLASQFLHSLWDVGVDIGHSVRTIEESLDLYGTSLDAWVAVLESRYLCGNRSLVDSMYGEMNQRLATPKDMWLVEMIFDDVENRHSRYGDSVKLLEPNIKKSAGGLRDLHTAYWLYRGTEARTDSLPEKESAIRLFLSRLKATNILDPEDCDNAIAALEFLLRVRHEMHYRRNSLHDNLEYALQLEVAEGLGYGPKASVRSVEVFMREYYLHARTIFRVNHQLTQQFRETLERSRHPSPSAERVSDLLFIHDLTLSVNPEVDRFTVQADLFKVFVVIAEREVTPDARLRGVVERSRDLLSEGVADEEISHMFKRIFGSRNVSRTLRFMNDLNILGALITEFGDLVAFFQHSVYHYFTADEHTLIALGRVEKLREEPGVMREVFRNLRRKETLYLAILLHDIAKPRGLQDHETIGADMAVTILKRLRMNDVLDDVRFLVRNHLLMEQVAFRRNIHDPETIKEFASRFTRPELLDYLYLLTYADLSAVNINVWTEWKASLLQELFQQTSELLRRNLKGDEVDSFHSTRQERVFEQVVEGLSGTLTRKDVEEHLTGINSDAYVALFNEGEIGDHIRHAGTDAKATTLFSHAEGSTEVTVIAKDAPFALARMCAVLSANDANIFDAMIFTREDGLIINRFRVTGTSSHQTLDPSICSKIQKDMIDLFEESIDIDHLFQAHSRRWKRRPRMPMNPDTRIAVEFEQTPRFTIVDVYAPDSVGFLFRITESISELGLDIHFAKIATRVDGIVDAFYVREQDGDLVSSSEREEQIRAALLETVQSLLDQELS